MTRYGQTDTNVDGTPTRSTPSGVHTAGSHWFTDACTARAEATGALDVKCSLDLFRVVWVASVLSGGASRGSGRTPWVGRVGM